LKELRAIHRTPILVKRNSVNDGASRCTVLVIGSDGVVKHNSLMYFSGTSNFYACRFCLAKGKHRVDRKIDEDSNIQEESHSISFEAILQDTIGSYLQIKRSSWKTLGARAYIIFFISHFGITQDWNTI
jgi:hypothetical protein